MRIEVRCQKLDVRSQKCGGGQQPEDEDGRTCQ
jgi:hypothetical protein